MKAVVDTNVLVSALLSRRSDSPTVRILHALLDGRFTPLYAPGVIAEYRDVLSRPHFRFDSEAVAVLIDRIVSIGEIVEPADSEEVFPDDPDDKVFYCVALAKSDEDAKLVTGNARHYPQSSFVVTPAEFCDLIGI